MSLRARLLLAVITLAAVGLLVADIVTYTLLNSFLTDRLDQQLLQATEPTAHMLNDLASGRETPPGVTGRGPSPLPPGTYTALLDNQGHVTTHVTFGFTASDQTAEPVLPNPVPLAQGQAQLVLTLRGTGGAESYQAVIAQPHDSASQVLVAIPLTEIESTLRRLLLLEVVVGAVVLVALGVLAAWAVRLGLQPLDRIAATADEIAQGHLQRRVSPATKRTEIGRLGLALNAMLAKIEEAFAARQASEDRLRRFVADASHEL
ncbi:MAG TPA: HAMP domain-containing protein, partial [Chloroflexota bacterium]|nr:HAMP domain-containing protein [Chloroflexota bacterium]